MSSEPHAKYKVCTLPWLDTIPAHWHETRVKFEAPFQVGWTPPTKNDENFVGDNFWANISDLKTKTVCETAKRISDQAAAASSMEITPRGSLLYSFKLSVGASAFAGVDMYTNEAIASFLARSVLPLQYLYYAFQVFIIRNAATNIYGARILNQELIRNAPFVAPPPSEAAQIANFLDYETAKIDALIEKQQQLIKLLKEKRQAVISHAVTKGLNPDAPMRDSGVEWLGEVPAHWTVGRYKFLTTRVVVGIAEAATHAYSDEGVPIIRSTNIKRNGLSEDGLLYIKPEFAAKNESKFLYEGDVVTVRTGYPGVSAVVPPSLNRSQCFTNLIATPVGECEAYFLSGFLNCHVGEKYFDLVGWGSAQKNISVPILKNVPIAWPAKFEQQEIVAYAGEQNAKFSALIASAGSQVTLLKERRAALISAAVTGKIDVRNWTPSESDPEPAVV